MHLAEGVLPLWQAAAWSAAAALPLWWSARGDKVEPEGAPGRGALMAAGTSLLFAATLFPVPVPVLGATSHLCMTPLLALLLGLRRVLWPTTLVLLAQALFFAHGGLSTLGANALSLGLVGPLVAVAVSGLGLRLGWPLWARVGFGCGAGDLAVYLWDAVILALGLAEAAPVGVTFWAVLVGFAPVQAPLAVLEGALSAALVARLGVRRPELLPAGLRPAVGLGAALLVVTALAGCQYEALDEGTFSAVAEAAGRPASPSLVDLSQGEVGLAMSVLCLFGVGFVAGRAYERLLGGSA
jgi:cobalt/nickel transport system permease protein